MVGSIPDIPVPETIRVIGYDVPGLPLVLGIVVAVLLCVCCCCCCCCRKCRRSERVVASESFKWPSSSKFLKRVYPARPPKLFVNKYKDPVRTDVLVLDEEAAWIGLPCLVYSTVERDGDVRELKQHMFLRFREGAVYGIGYEDIRKLCKISGKYKLDVEANQIALAMTCTFWNKDAVMFHGWGNGTGLVGNCYIRELDPFSFYRSLPSLPGLRNMGATKFKASFMMLKLSGMGDADVWARLHTTNVQRWAGDLYPDDGMALPVSSPPASAEHSSSRRGSLSRGGGGGSVMEKILEYVTLPFGKRTPPASRSAGGSPPSSTPSRSSNELPPWVLTGTRMQAPNGEGRNGSGDGHGYPTEPSSARRARRPSLQPINTLNYLQQDGVPGRNGPSMV